MSTPTVADSAPIRTDARVYKLVESPGQFDAEAVATYTNRSGKTVAYKRCMPDAKGPMYDVKRVGPDTNPRSFVGGIWACVGGVPTGSVPPGGSVTVLVWLGSTKSPQADPPDRPEDRIGKFRILFSLCEREEADSDYCELLPEDDRMSNEFEIRF